MDNSTYFIENKALFGPYPSENDIAYLESIGVKYFIDLTEKDKLSPYKLSDKSVFIKYSIPDMKVPINSIEFSSLIVYLHDIITKLSDDEKIYIHCRGGNGRSGTVVACLLTRFHSPYMSSLDALQLTTKYHSERKNLKLKWKLMGSPQTSAQKNYVIKLFTPFCFHRDTLYGNKYGFVPYSKIPLHYDSYIFEDSYALYKFLIQQYIYITEDDIYKCMKYVQSIKISQCTLFMNNLLNTNLRPIIYCNAHDTYWGVNKQGVGQNILGKILTQLRDELLLNLYD